MYFFFSSRRRHTRCALVTGVQTCALPILPADVGGFLSFRAGHAVRGAQQLARGQAVTLPNPLLRGFDLRGIIAALEESHDRVVAHADRSEERRVGKECVSTCRSRWSQYTSKKKENRYKHKRQRYTK